MISKKIITSFLVFSAAAMGQVSYHGLTSWYHISEVSMSGGGSSMEGSAHSSVNPAVISGLKRSVETGMVRYPAGIGAETFMLIVPAGHQTYGFEIRHIGYGIFKGFDEQGVETEDYSANDTWVVGTLAVKAKNNRLKLGLSGGVLRSQVQNYLSYAVTASMGGIYTFPGQGIALSAGIKNAGAVARDYSRAEQSLPLAGFFGFSKKLQYLPLRVGIDLLSQNGSDKPLAMLHFRFNSSEQLRILAGVSTNRIDQTTDFVFRNYLSAASAGIIYLNKGISIKTGAHFIGPGGLVIGFGVGMVF